MTQEQYQWLKNNGYDPAVYDVDNEGNIFENPVQAAEPQREVMSKPRAFGTSFAGSLLPSAAGLGGAKLGMMAGAPFGPVGIGLGAIGGGLGAGYLAGKGQEAVLEKVAPEAIAEMQRAQTDQPVTSYLGGFAPNALAFRPSLQGMGGLLRPVMRREESLRAALNNPNFLAPAANVAANVGASTAGQLINVAEGGEFSAPRFAADVGLGVLFNRPTALGRAMGFHDMPQGRPVEKSDLAAATDRAQFMAEPPKEFVTPREERGAQNIERPGVNIGVEGPEQYFTSEKLAGEGIRRSEAAINKDYTKWWKSETEPTTDLIKGAAEEVKMKVPKEKLAELANDPEVGEVLRDPSKMAAFVAKQADESLEMAFQNYRRPAMEAAREVYSAELEGISGRPPSVSKAAEGYQFIRPTEPPKSALEAGREVYSAELEGPSGRPPSIGTVAKADKTAYEAYSGQRPPEAVKNATDAAREVYTRLQRAPEEGPRKITQQDIDFAAEVAARRGLKIELDRAFTEGGQEVRGMYFVDENGNRIIRVNPLMATSDTAIHEIGHDIFTGVTNKGMRRSLMETAIDSPAYKAELAAREAEVKAGFLTPEKAQEIALEEGLIQAFGEQVPNINRGELRAWFSAFKASMKQLVTGKMTPQDALAWMHYASTEAVPWKGAVAVKGGEERFSRAKEASRRLTADDMDWDNMGLRTGQRSVNLEDLISSVLPELKMYQEKPNVFREDVVISREPRLLSNEGSWGRAYTTGARNEGHVVIDGALWDAAVANEPGSRERFVNVLKHELGHIDDAPNIGELGAARDERVADEFAARYQRSLVSEAGTPAELDYLAKRGGVHAEVANDLRAAYNTRDYKQGQWSSKYSKTMALRPEDQVRLLNHLAGEFDSGIRSTPAPELREAYDQIRNEYLPGIVSEYNNAGFKVRDTAGLRARGSNPTYFPLHVIADDVKTVLTTQQGSPEFVKLKDDFLKWNTQLKQADGATLQEAQKYALDKFNESQAITAQRPGIESGIPFSGARKPEGYPLPPSWRSNDIVDMLNKYTRRSATDFAYQKHVESSPVTMAALGAKTMVNDQPIPANVLQTTEPIVNDPSVQSILREYRGTPAQKTEGMLQSAGRFVSAATIGTVSKIGDIGTSMFKGLAYLPGSEYVGGLADFTNRIANWSALKERAYSSGLNKRDAAENMRQVLGIAEDSTAFMDKAARLLSKATFVNDLESVARTIAQGWGETVIGINKKLALGGDKNATQMLDTLSPDWRTRPDADLAAQVGRLLQGSYDMRQLPASVLEGAAAPYLTWSKWSIGQYNNFLNYAIKPAMQGNMKPLIGQMLIGLLGGGAVSAVQEWMNNREGKDITWKELEAWMEQNQGELGADGGQLLGQKLLTMAQKMGTFGFAGDLAKMVLDSAAGGTAQGVATMPAMDAIFDVAKRAAAAGKALDDGEDFGLVMKALMKDSLVGHVQVLRVARNWLDEDENLRYDDRRRRRLYDELTGAPSRGGAFTVNYSNLSEREFERGEISPKTGEEAFSLVSRARQESTTPEEYASRIRKYKTAQNEIMPSMERQPMKAARYLSWLEGAEEGAGAETMRRYMIREQENKYRKSLIEGLSGLR